MVRSVQTARSVPKVHSDQMALSGRQVPAVRLNLTPRWAPRGHSVQEVHSAQRVLLDP
jgi:hypothetical protein